MKRKITSKFLEWKEKPTRKPLVLQGVRQCGKTYALCEFGKELFPKKLYFNFEKESRLRSIFDYDYDCRRILHELSVHANVSEIELTDTLIIFDEIQECPKAITSLKYFAEEHPDAYIAAAGSLLGPALSHHQISFPVGKVEFMMMYPLSFEEFLWAKGFEKELALISCYDLDRPLTDEIIDRLRHLCKIYYIIGGMPEVVDNWLSKGDFASAEKIQDDIVESYVRDFGKYLNPVEALRVAWIWDSIPVQLAKENNKFVFSHVKQGKRAVDLEDSLQWLNKAGLVYQLMMVPNPGLPLKFYADTTYFKVYMCDVGLLRRISGVEPSTILDDTPLYNQFKGAFTENFVMGELMKLGITPYFWRSSNTAEVDFLIQSHESVVPIESKAEQNTKAKSYRVYCERYKPTNGIKLSMKNVGENMVGNTTTYSLPLFLLWRLPAYLQKM